MKKRFLYLLLPIITLILEILPYGSVCVFASSPTEQVKKTFSYFDLTPFGYANFTPLLTALTTCVILVLLLVYLFADNSRTIAVTKVFLCIGAVLSLCPLLFGIEYLSVVGALISASLIVELVLLICTAKPHCK